MFGFGKKKTPVVPPQREKRQRTSGKSKEDYKDDLAKLGLLSMSTDMEGLDVGDSDSEIDEGDLEDELLAIIGEDAGSMDALLTQSNDKPSPILSASHPTPSDAVVESIFKAPPPPTTISEALYQRLEKYNSELEKATNAGEGPSKVRRIGRIVKQYEDAIAAHKKGRPIAYDELPTPPGFAPIPLSSSSAPPVPKRPIQNKVDDSLILRQLSLEADAELSDSPESDDPMTSPILTPDEDNLLISFNPTPQPVAKSVETVRTSDTKISRNDEPLLPSPSPKKSQVVISQETVDNEKLTLLLQRQKQYKEAALVAKRSADIAQARELLKIAKGFDKLIEDAGAGLDVDMSLLPSPPPPPNLIPIERETPLSQVENFIPEKPLPATETEEPAVDIFNAPPPPRTILEALEQRLEKYKSEVEKANESNNSGKARRMGRIVKQYEEAIAAHKKGRPVIFDELPTPPGFGPIPTGIAVAAPPTPSAAGPGPQAPKSVAPGNSPSTSPAQSQGQPHHHGSINRGANKSQTKLTLQEKQLRTLLTRQKLFKDAALNAKKRGDIAQAKEFLKTAKGFDKLIQASEGGLPVDMATLPSPPDAVASLAFETSDDFEIVRSADCIAPPDGSSADVFTKLEEDLREQLKMCMRIRDHFKSMGDIASGNRFEKLAIETKRDLDTLRLAVKGHDALPQYHYETRIFSITECNFDLTDDEIEINVLKGINYKVPNPADVDTFIKVDLPYPSAEETQTNKTGVIRDTNNPDYAATFKMKINKTARPYQRFIHRHGVKLELWSKGGFLRSSSLLGTATVKLLPLETKCTLHDAFDVMEGRRCVGKIEVKIRVREPVLTKQITQKKEKWLSIDRV